MVVPVRAAAGRIGVSSAFGAALLYGDGIITPAISVLSAIEGLQVATPFFTPYVIPITIGVLVLLFFFQHHGTAGIGKVFGPVIVLWFIVLAVLGGWHIAARPGVLAAVDPLYALRFFALNRWTALTSSRCPRRTGAEALYADRVNASADTHRLVLSSCGSYVNYFGQGGAGLGDQAAAEHVLHWLRAGRLPVVILATMAP